MDDNNVDSDEVGRNIENVIEKATREQREAWDELDLLRVENEQLRVERDRWRKIADDFAEAGTHPTAHDMAVEDYEEACSGWRGDDHVVAPPVTQSSPLQGRFEGSPLVDVLTTEREADRSGNSSQCWLCNVWGCETYEGHLCSEGDLCACECHENPASFRDASEEVHQLRAEVNRWKHVADYFKNADRYLNDGLPPDSVWLREAIEDYRRANGD